MKVLFIGGTGLISSACSELAVQRGHDLTLLNRSQSEKYAPPAGARVVRADVQAGAEAVRSVLAGEQFDVVVDWIAYTPADIERDLAVFEGRCGQFLFISSASAYQKPPRHYRITEETPLDNPYWQYSRDKIACEARLMQAWQDRKFPATVIRPSLTYGPTQIPLAVNSWQHPYTVIQRMKTRQPVIIPGDGTSLWVLTWNADFAVGMVGLFGNPAALGEAFHITSEEVLTWNQIYAETARAVGVEADFVHIPSDLLAAYDGHYTGSLIGDKANSVIFDNSKIKRYVPELNCKVTWSEGVRRSLAWFEGDPARQTIDAAANQRWDAVIAAYRRAFPNA